MILRERVVVEHLEFIGRYEVMKCIDCVCNA